MKQLLFFIAVLSLFSCTDQGRVLPNPSGRAGEVLIVMNDAHWNAESGQVLQHAFKQDVQGLAWSEPLFDVSHLQRQSYNDMVRIARNVVDVEVGNRYAVGKIKFFEEKYAKTQAYAKIQAPDEASLLKLIQDNHTKLVSFFYKAERRRLTVYFEKNENLEYQEKVNTLMGYDMVIPAMFNHNNFSGKDFIWLSGGNAEARTDLALYTFPCSSTTKITRELLIAKRDSVMKINVPGPSEGSFMRTADVVEPTFEKVIINKNYVYEMRGLWETSVDFMGGPFISYAYQDTVNQQVKVLEGFIYAPHEDKRNLLRRIEAVAYSWKADK